MVFHNNCENQANQVGFCRDAMIVLSEILRIVACERYNIEVEQQAITNPPPDVILSAAKDLRCAVSSQ
jgi:hypothetical protein